MPLQQFLGFLAAVAAFRVDAALPVVAAPQSLTYS
jgi:hypothetical protein